MSKDVTLTVDESASSKRPVRGFVGQAKLIGGLTLVSRILGLARESIAAYFFGAGAVWSAFTVAFSIPNLFRKLLGEGALSAAFIPLYTHELKNQHPDKAAEFASASVNLLLVILVGITAVGEVVLWTTVWGSPGLRADRMLMLKLTAIMLPYVMMVCGAAFLGAILQVHRRFGVFAAVPFVLNICHITVIGLGAWALHLNVRAPADDPVANAKQIRLAYWLASSVLVAGGLQVMMLWPSLKAVGFRFRWVGNFWTPTVKRMLRLSVPVALGAGVLQLSVLLDKAISFMLTENFDPVRKITIDHFQFLGHWFRYPMAEGAPARLGWAQFMYQFPLGIFAIALATAIFPGLSAHALEADRSQFRRVMRQGIEMALLEGLPCSIGLMIVRVPAIRLLFQHGQFTPAATDLVARSLMWYAAAIWAYSMLQIINRAYYALHDTMTPLVMSVVNIGINLVVELPLIWTGLGEAGMAVGTCVSFAIQALVMLYMLDRRIGGLELRKIGHAVVKMLVASVLMWGACAGLQKLPYFPSGGGRIETVAQLIILMSVGAAVYFGACAVMGVDVMQHLLPKRFRRAEGV